MSTGAAAAVSSSKQHRFERDVDVTANRIRLTAQLDVQGGTIGPGEYPKFSTWARGVDRLERIIIKRQNPVSQTPASKRQSPRLETAGVVRRTGNP